MNNNSIISDWIEYKYGWYRRIGDCMQVKAFKRIMPIGFMPDYDYYSSRLNKTNFLVHFDYFEGLWNWTVKIKGWETKTLIAKA